MSAEDARRVARGDDLKALAAERAVLLSRIAKLDDEIDAAFEGLQRPCFPAIERGFPSVYARALREHRVYVEISPGRLVDVLEAEGWRKLAELVEREQAFGDASRIYAEAYRARGSAVAAWESAIAEAEERAGVPVLKERLTALQAEVDVIEAAILGGAVESLEHLRVKAKLLLEELEYGNSPDPRPLLRDVLALSSLDKAA